MAIPGSAMDAPLEKTFDQLREDIHHRYDGLSDGMRRIARAVLQDPDTVALSTVTQVAEMCDIQPSGVVRFAQTFGFSGYSEMQRVFRLRLIEGAPALRDQVQRTRGDLLREANSEPHLVLREFMEASVRAIERLADKVDPADFARAVDMLTAAESVYVLAQRRAFPIAAYIAYGLQRLEMPAHLLDAVGGMLPQQVAAMRPDDLLVAVSFEPYSPQVVDLVEDAYIRGLPVLTITDTPVSPLIRNATLGFAVEEFHATNFRPVSAPMCLAQSLVATLGLRRAADTPS